jgi:hypothetical protein
MTLATLLKMVLMEFATPGMIAPAATATKPAMSAYSMRSCPWVSLHTRGVKIEGMSFLTRVSSHLVCGYLARDALRFTP